MGALSTIEAAIATQTAAALQHQADAEQALADAIQLRDEAAAIRDAMEVTAGQVKEARKKAEQAAALAASGASEALGVALTAYNDVLSALGGQCKSVGGVGGGSGGSETYAFVTFSVPGSDFWDLNSMPDNGEPHGRVNNLPVVVDDQGLSVNGRIQVPAWATRLKLTLELERTIDFYDEGYGAIGQSTPDFPMYLDADQSGLSATIQATTAIDDSLVPKTYWKWLYQTSLELGPSFTVGAQWVELRGGPRFVWGPNPAPYPQLGSGQTQGFYKIEFFSI